MYYTLYNTVNADHVADRPTLAEDEHEPPFEDIPHELEPTHRVVALYLQSCRSPHLDADIHDYLCQYNLWPLAPELPLEPIWSNLLFSIAQLAQ